MVIKKSVSVLVMLVLVFSMIGIVSAETRWVSNTTGNDVDTCISPLVCKTIQYALNRANNGDTIAVGSGTYTENLMINKSDLTINSTGGASSTTINGTIVINASNVVIGGVVDKGFLIGINNSIILEINLINLTDGADNVEISHNIFNTSGHPEIAILMSGTTGVGLQNITIYNNIFYFAENRTDRGIESNDLTNISGLNITSNTFNISQGGAVPTSSYLSAISITVPDISSLPTIIQGNTIRNAEQGIAIGNVTDNIGLLPGSSYFEINNNTFEQNNISIDIISANGVYNLSLQNITIINNNFSNSYLVAIAINSSIYSTGLETFNLHASNFTIDHNIFIGNNLGINNTHNHRNETVKAENNYWGNETGPGGAFLDVGGAGGAGSGDNITANVDYSPWANNVNFSETVNIQIRNFSFDVTDPASYYFMELQGAIDNASDGDIIEIGDGEFYEFNITVNKEVTITGNGSNTNLSFGDNNYGFNISADNVVIENLNLTLANPNVFYDDLNISDEKTAINVLGDNVVIDSLIITTSGNRSIAIKIGAGNITNATYFASTVQPMVTNLTITDNTITIIDMATGILLSPANTTNIHSDWLIARNTITANNGVPIELYDLNNSEVTYNNLTTDNRSIIGNISTIGNFIWGSVYQNISNLTFAYNTLNNTNNYADSSIIWFRNLSLNKLEDINVSKNVIDNWGNGTGIWFENGVSGSAILVNFNNFSNPWYSDNLSMGYAVQHDGLTAINATLNYWGNITGPGGNDSNGGGAINGLITYWPYYSDAAMTTLSTVPGATTTDDDSSSGGGGAAAVVKWKMTYIASGEQLQAQEGYNKEMSIKQRVKFKVGDDYHHVGVTGITDSTTTIEVSSEVQEATLVVGDIRKFDVTEDGYYDLSVVLNSISGSKADVTIKSIYEEITVESEEEEVIREEEADKVKEQEIKEAEKSRIWTWIIVIVAIVVIVLILIGVGYGVKKKR